MNVIGRMEDAPDNRRRVFNNPHGVPDTSRIRVVPDFTPLRYSDEELRAMTRHWSAETVDIIPGFRYWETGVVRRMDQAYNQCGHHQRAFDFYWSIRAGVQEGGVCLGVGTTSVAGPAVLGTDKYYGKATPDQDRYGSDYGYPYFSMDANQEFPFFPLQFFGAAANHVLEHVQDIFFTLGEMLRVVRKGAPVWFIMPDMTYSARGAVDPTHTREWSADEFFYALDEKLDQLPPFDVLSWNTLDNAFSFDGVLIRR